MTILVDSTGRFAYRGPEDNPKVADLKATGHVEVSTMPPVPFSDHRWDGAVWVLDPVIEKGAMNAEDIFRILKVKFPQITDADLPPEVRIPPPTRIK